MFSCGLLTLAATCPPASCTAASLPDLNGTYANATWPIFSICRTSTWSVSFDAVPAIASFVPGLRAASRNPATV